MPIDLEANIPRPRLLSHSRPWWPRWHAGRLRRRRIGRRGALWRRRAAGRSGTAGAGAGRRRGGAGGVGGGTRWGGLRGGSLDGRWGEGVGASHDLRRRQRLLLPVFGGKKLELVPWPLLDISSHSL